MKSKKKAVMLAITMLAVMLLNVFVSTGCYAVNFDLSMLTVMAPMGNGPYYKDWAYNAAVDDHSYWFDFDIERKQRSEFIKAQEELCAYLEENGFSTDNMTFCLFEAPGGWSSSVQGRAFFDTTMIRSWQQIVYTLLTTMGDYTNYGYVYALADNIAAELEWQQDAPGSPAYSFKESNINLLNLEYPSFSEYYVLDYDIVLCKNAAIELMAEMNDIWSLKEFIINRNIMARSISSEFEPTYLKFAPAGNLCALRMQTKYLNVYVAPEYFTAPYYIEYYATIGKVDSIDKLIDTYEPLDEQIGKVREIFMFEDNEPVETFVMGELIELENNTDDTVAVYFNDSRQIHALSEIAILHEYVHHMEYSAITDADPELQLWNIEALAYYYAIDNTFKLQMVYFDKYPRARTYIDDAIGQLYNTPSDEILYQRCRIRNVEPKDGFALVNDFTVIASFGEYFVRTYSDEMFIYSMINPSLTEPLVGKPLDAIIEDWIADVSDPANDELLVLPQINDQQ